MCSVNRLTQTALSNSRNAVSISSARTTKRLPSSRRASAIQIVRPRESNADTQPQLHPALLRLSATTLSTSARRIPSLYGSAYRSRTQYPYIRNLEVAVCLLLTFWGREREEAYNGLAR